jgi:hypothetical protein
MSDRGFRVVIVHCISGDENGVEKNQKRPYVDSLAL